jgi:hypothetical protein
MGRIDDIRNKGTQSNYSPNYWLYYLVGDLIDYLYKSS